MELVAVRWEEGLFRGGFGDEDVKSEFFDF